MKNVYIIFNKEVSRRYLSILVKFLCDNNIDVFSSYSIHYWQAGIISRLRIVPERTKCLSLEAGIRQSTAIIIITSKSLFKKEWPELVEVLKDNQHLIHRFNILILKYEKYIYDLNKMLEIPIPTISLEGSSIRNLRRLLILHGDEIIRHIYPGQKAEMPWRDLEILEKQEQIAIGEEYDEMHERKIIDDKTDEKAKIPPLKRCLQCRIIEPGRETEEYEKNYLKPESEYYLVGRIGLPDCRYINANESFKDDILAEYPSEITPEGEKGHTLRLILYELFQETNPQVDELFFPEKGNSKEVLFNIKTPSNKSLYQARIIVMYRNRTLQTALFCV